MYTLSKGVRTKNNSTVIENYSSSRSSITSGTNSDKEIPNSDKEIPTMKSYRINSLQTIGLSTPTREYKRRIHVSSSVLKRRKSHLISSRK